MKMEKKNTGMPILDIFVTFYASVMSGFGVLFIGTYIRMNIILTLVLSYLYAAGVGIILAKLMANYNKTKDSNA